MSVSGRETVAGWDVHAYDVLPGSNDEAARLARAAGAAGRSADDPVAVWTLRQTAGRGRRGRPWVSAEGNLFVSMILRPQVVPARAAELSFVAALAVAETVATLAPDAGAVVCKWPNDVLLDGGKIAGVLLESEAGEDGNVAWVVVGVGINLASHPSDVERRATSLPQAPAPRAALAVLLQAMSRRYEMWRTQGFAAIRADWLARSIGVGQAVSVRLAQETAEGVFHGLDSDGVLLLDVGLGLPLRRITAGDVFFAGEA